jgi:hypothetical protein
MLQYTLDRDIATVSCNVSTNSAQALVGDHMLLGDLVRCWIMFMNVCIIKKAVAMVMMLRELGLTG